MGRTPSEARETIRFSLGWGSTDADVDETVAAVAQALAVLPARPSGDAAAAQAGGGR
jgi:cysteine sulfinate desulfinase/cysteine desulfurase-like protein